MLERNWCDFSGLAGVFSRAAAAEHSLGRKPQERRPTPFVESPEGATQTSVAAPMSPLPSRHMSDRLQSEVCGYTPIVGYLGRRFLWEFVTVMVRLSND
jgi:hypothetical protein